MRPHSYQSRLGSVLRFLFPDHHILENVRKQSGIIATSKRPLELDYWIPELHLAFEYQDPYHYTTTWYQTRMAAVRGRDDFKKVALSLRDETLIIVPYWWDGSSASLTSTIIALRPDLGNQLSSTSVKLPIPSHPPTNFFEGNTCEGIGALMLASFPDGSVPRGLDSWWLSEKYDGFRGLWNPINKTLYSRFGRAVQLSSTISKLYVDRVLDGELWFGRGAFLESQKMFTRSEQDTISWHWLRMNIIDLPSVDHQAYSIEKRTDILVRSIPCDHPFLIPIANITSRANEDGCNSFQNQQNYCSLLHHILSDRGEGIVLRAPSSPYTPGRSDLWLKLKMVRDQEALVISVSSNNLDEDCYLLLLADGTTCTATGTHTETQKKNMYKSEEVRQESLCEAIQRGDVVTFSYTAHNKDSRGPQGCRVMRRRHDLSWQDVLFSATSHIRDAMIMPKEPTKVEWEGKKKPPGFWSMYDAERNNVRDFFDDFARSKNVDGSIPENWFSFTKRDILQEKGGASILRLYSSSLRLALAAAYPTSIGMVADDVKFRVGFRKLPTKFWDIQLNRKQFLHNIASGKFLDPYSLDTWYGISKEDIQKQQGGLSFIRYCAKQGKSLTTVIRECFSLNGVERNDNRTLALQSSQDRRYYETDREYIEAYAIALGIDMHSQDSWNTHFPVIHSRIMSDKFGIELANRYQGVSKAVAHLFPELRMVAASLESLLLAHQKEGIKLLKQRVFFEALARRQAFDPLQASNWYTISLDTIYSMQGAKTILKNPATFVSILQKAFPKVLFVEKNFVCNNAKL